MQFIKGPDFPTGGIIMGKAGIHEAYATGRGQHRYPRPQRDRAHAAGPAAASW